MAVPNLPSPAVEIGDISSFTPAGIDHVDSVPADGSSNPGNHNPSGNSGNPPQPFGRFERGSVIPGSIQERGINPHSNVELTPELELELYDLVEEVVSFMENSHLGNELPILAAAIKDRFPHWKE